MALVVLALGAINMLAVAWWAMGMVPGSSGGSSSGGSSSSAPPPPPLWSPEEEKAMKASPAAFTDIMSARMQEEAYTAAKAAASKVVDNLSMEDLLKAKKNKGRNMVSTGGAGPQQPGPVPKKPGLLAVQEEDAEMVHCEAAAVEPSILGSWTVANDATVGPMKAGPVVDDDMVSTCAPSEETTEGGAIYSCMTCKLELYKSGFLLCDDNVESHDWAGRLWGTCEGCSDYPNRAAFKKAVKNAWKKTSRRHAAATHAPTDTSHKVQRVNHVDQDTLP